MDVLLCSYIFNNKKIHHKTLKVKYQIDALMMIYCSQATVCPFISNIFGFYWQKYTKVLVPWITSLCGHTSNTEKFHIIWDGSPVLIIPLARSKIYGTNSLRLCESLIWNKLPNLVRSSRSVIEFENIIKKTRKTDYGCMICRSTPWANFHLSLVLLVLFVLVFFRIM